MGRVQQIAGPKDSPAWTDYLSQHGPMLLPMVELIEQAQMAVDVKPREVCRRVVELCG